MKSWSLLRWVEKSIASGSGSAFGVTGSWVGLAGFVRAVGAIEAGDAMMGSLLNGSFENPELGKGRKSGTLCCDRAQSIKAVFDPAAAIEGELAGPIVGAGSCAACGSIPTSRALATRFEVRNRCRIVCNSRL